MFSLNIWVSVAFSILLLKTAAAQQQLSGSADADSTSSLFYVAPCCMRSVATSL